MNILLFDNGTQYQTSLLNLLSKHGKTTISTNPALLKFSDADLIVLSGGHHTYITERPEVYRTEVDFLNNTDKPTLGICLGAELIAYAFNAKLEFLEQKAKGVTEIEVISQNHIFNNIKDFRVYENHSIAVTSLSDALEGLAKSESGFEVFKHKTKPIYGLQFHPEMLEDTTFGDEIFSSIVNLFR